MKHDPMPGHDNPWSQLEMETAIEFAMWVGERAFPACEHMQELVDNAGGISQWIQNRAKEFEEIRKDTDWPVTGDFYEDVEAWITAYVVAQRLA